LLAPSTLTGRKADRTTPQVRLKVLDIEVDPSISLIQIAHNLYLYRTYLVALKGKQAIT